MKKKVKFIWGLPERRKYLKRITKITEFFQVVVMTPLGYPNRPPPRSPERVLIESFALSNMNEKETGFQVELATPDKQPLFQPHPPLKNIFLDKFLLNR
jgi:hypothetical protein